MLDIHGLVFHGDSLLHGDDMHADTAAAGRYQMGDTGQRDIGHALEEVSHVRMFAQALIALGSFFHVEHLCAAGNEQRQAVTAIRGAGDGAVMVVVVAVVIFQQTDIAHLIQQLLEVCLVLFLDLAQLPHLLNGIVMAHLHRQSDVRHLIGNNGGKTPVFRVIGSQTLDLVDHHISDFLAQLQNLFAGCSLTLMRRVQCAVFHFLIDHGVLLLILSTALLAHAASPPELRRPHRSWPRWGRSECWGYACVRIGSPVPYQNRSREVHRFY